MDNLENNKNNLPEEDEVIINEVVKEIELATDEDDASENKLKDEEYCPSIFDKPDYSYEKPRKNSKISKQTLTIIISLVVCIALGFGVWGIFKLIPSDGVTSTDESSEAAEETKYIYDYSHYLSDFSDSKDADTYPELVGTDGYKKGLALGGISRIDVKNTATNFYLTPDYYTRVEMNPETMEDEEKTTLEWYMTSIEGVDMKGVKFDIDYTEFVVQDLLRLPYKSVYVEDKNAKLPDGSMTYFNECGFDKPIATPSITFKDGSKLTVLVGSETPVKGEYYVTVEVETSDKDLLGKPKKDEKIYITQYENIAFYLKDAKHYVELDLITAPEDETYYTDLGEEVPDKYFLMGELSVFDSLSISGRNTDGKIEFKVVDANTPPYTTMYLMTTPRKQCADVEKIASLLSPISGGFRAASCLSMRGTTAEMQKYGLANPLYKVTYVVKNVTYVLTVGNKFADGDLKGNYPVMVNGNPSIFLASADVLPFVNNKSIDYTNDSIFAADIGEIKSLDVNIKGKKYNFTLIHGEENEDLVVTLNGKTINTESFRNMYVDVLSMTSRGDVSHVTDAKNQNEALSLTFNYVKHSHSDKISLYPYSDRRYSCLLNGAGDWTMYSTSVEKVIKSVEGLAK